LRLLGDEDLAEECVAETFFRFLRALQNGGQPIRKLKPYLYRIAHNWIQDHYRHKGRRPLEILDASYADPQRAVDEETERHLLQEQARAALANLTAEQRLVIVLHFIEGWDQASIATFQLPETASPAAQQALARVRQMIQARLRLLEDCAGDPQQLHLRLQTQTQTQEQQNAPGQGNPTPGNATPGAGNGNPALGSGGNPAPGSGGNPDPSSGGDNPAPSSGNPDPGNGGSNPDPGSGGGSPDPGSGGGSNQPGSGGGSGSGGKKP
jgi:RNA polymerase sigma-70 factor (ECF subfamily)